MRWVPPENLHITSLFLGNVEENKIADLVKASEDLVKGFIPFNLTFDQYALIPQGNRARMIWARYNEENAFEELMKGLEKMAASVIDLKPDRKKAIPHVTLCRFKQFRAVRLLDLKGEPMQKEVEVNSCILWESQLHSTGAVYTAVQEFFFSGH